MYEEDNQNEIKVVLDNPHSGQKAVINSKARFRVLQCGRRWGKSLVASIIAITDMLNGKKVAYVSPSHDLNKDFFQAIIDKLPAAVIKKDNKSELYIELITGGSIKFFSGESLNQFRGRKFHLVIVDEAAYIPGLKDAWESAIRPTLTDYINSKAIFISTPKGKGYFEALFQKGKNKETDWESFHYTSYDNPYILKSEIDSAKASLPEVVFNQEYLAISGEDAGNAFGSLDVINKNVIKTLSINPSVIYGIDVAKYHDFSVIIGLDEDGCLSHFDRFQAPWEVTYDKIKALPHSVLKKIDSTGVGSVILERLQLSVPNVEGYIFTNQSKANLIYKLKKAVEDSTVKYNQIIADEMSVFGYSYTSTGLIKYEATSGFYDDCVCALSLAYYHLDQRKAYKDWRLHFV